MIPAELGERLAAMDWSDKSLQHQLAIAAAVETLKGVIHEAAPVPVEAMRAPAPSNVVSIAPRRTRWTIICHLNGREWCRSTHFGPGGAWEWIVESVAAEFECGIDQVSCAESDDGDLVTVDGLPVYLVRHEFC